MQILVQVVCSKGPSLREAIVTDRKLDSFNLTVTEQKRQGRPHGWAKIHSSSPDRNGALNLEWDGDTSILVCRVVTRGPGRPNLIIGDFVVLLEYGADVNHQSEYGWTPLYLAAWKGHAEIAARLLEAGALADKRTKSGYSSPDGWTALHIASAGGHLNVVRALAEAGVSLRAKTRNGVSALELAAENGHRKVVAYLQRQAAKRSRRN